MATLDKEIKILMLKGETGGHVRSVEKTSTSGLVDTYTMTFDDGNSYNFNVTNGSSIQSIVKTSTSGLVDTYTITLTNGETTTFTVTNGEDGEVTTQQLNDAINDIANKTSGSLIGRIINSGTEVRLIVSDDLGTNGVLIIIDGTNNKILVRKVVNGVIEKEYDLFTEIDGIDGRLDNLEAKIPLTSGTQDDRLYYTGLYEVTYDSGNTKVSTLYNVPSPISQAQLSYAQYYHFYNQRFNSSGECTMYSRIELDSYNMKVREFTNNGSIWTNTEKNFTWKLIINYGEDIISSN